MIGPIGEVRNRHGERIDAVFSPGAPSESTESTDPRRVVLVAHGVTGRMDRPYLVAICDALAEAGLPSLRFTYAGNPGSEGRFEECTISKEIDDLGAVIDAARGVGFERVTYVGHSMGGAIGALRAADDARIDSYVSLAGMVHIADFMDRTFGLLEPGRDVMLDKPECPLTAAFLADARAHGSTLDAVRRLTIPTLIVHGTDDELVPFQDGLDHRDAAPSVTQLVPLPGVDHRFTDHHEVVAATVTRFVAQLADDAV